MEVKWYRQLVFLLIMIIIVPNFLGNQGWPSVAYNEQIDEYMIAFQFRAGALQYFSNKYIIISQRVQSARTERAAGPSLLVKANGQGGSTDWVDAMGPLIKYNPVTGKNQAPVVQKVDCANPISFPNTYPPNSDLSGGLQCCVHLQGRNESYRAVSSYFNTVQGSSNFRVCGLHANE